MKNMQIWLAALLLLPSIVFSQSTLSGVIVNMETLVPVEQAHVQIVGSTEGTITSSEGEFNFSTATTKAVIQVTSLGYKIKKINVGNIDGNKTLGIIFLEPIPYSLDEITVSAGVRSYENMPSNISTISSSEIERTIGDQPLPIVLNTTPGVFSVRDGGGSGDARLSIRGFHQENISLLLNGIPINGEENGLVYWSNWLGLSNSATEIQIQKGAGMPNGSIYGIGAVVNIITRNSQIKPSGTLGIETTDYGNFSSNIILNSGRLSNGWSVSTMINYERGKGYIDATSVNSLAYFFTADKKLNNKHELNITLLGAPQKHGQRTIKLSNKEVEIHGIKFNKDWGGFNGKVRNASQNFYHKPFLTISDNYKINQKNLLNTTIYLSYGYGGGLWSESFNYAPSIFSYRDYSDQLDWYTIYANNATHNETYTLANGETVSGFSRNVQTKFLASHIQTGLVSDYEYKFSDNLKFRIGIHYRYFNSFLREEIDDLLGGKFYIEDYGWSLAGVSGRDQIKTVGDIIKVDNNTIINFAKVYSQLVYSSQKVTAFIAISESNNWYRRVDRFNYITNNKSDVVFRAGYDLRAGLNFNINEFTGAYFNVAHISRAPYFKYVFGNFTNVVVANLENETANNVEIGYKLHKNLFMLNLSAYYTLRDNISMLSNEYIQLEDNNQTRAMINGLSSTNLGLEIEGSYLISDNIKLNGWMSIGDFSWNNDVNATLFNDNNIAVDTVNVYAKGLFIGGTAQNQFGGSVDFKLFNSINIRAEYMYFSKIYSDFDPTKRNIPDDYTQPFKIPSYGVANVFIGIPFKVGQHFGNFRLNVYNVLNTKYIVLGEDGPNHDLETFRGFWSFGRNISLGLNFSL